MMIKILNLLQNNKIATECLAAVLIYNVGVPFLYGVDSETTDTSTLISQLQENSAASTSGQTSKNPIPVPGDPPSDPHTAFLGNGAIATLRPTTVTSLGLEGVRTGESQETIRGEFLGKLGMLKNLAGELKTVGNQKAVMTASFYSKERWEGADRTTISFFEERLKAFLICQRARDTLSQEGDDETSGLYQQTLRLAKGLEDPSEGLAQLEKIGLNLFKGINNFCPRIIPSLATTEDQILLTQAIRTHFEKTNRELDEIALCFGQNPAERKLLLKNFTDSHLNTAISYLGFLFDTLSSHSEIKRIEGLVDFQFGFNFDRILNLIYENQSKRAARELGDQIENYLDSTETVRRQEETKRIRGDLKYLFELAREEKIRLSDNAMHFLRQHQAGMVRIIPDLDETGNVTIHSARVALPDFGRVYRAARRLFDEYQIGLEKRQITLPRESLNLLLSVNYSLWVRGYLNTRLVSGDETEL